jgi:hypothetical protein
MKQRIYIDTSVIGGCEDKEFSKWSIQLFEADLRDGTNPTDPEAGFGAKQGKCCISVDSRIPLALWGKWSGIW